MTPGSVVAAALQRSVAWAWLINGLWGTYCVHTGVGHLRHTEDAGLILGGAAEEWNRKSPIAVVVPMLHEADRASACVAHWAKLLDECPPLGLCVVTTERERGEAPDALHTWDVLAADTSLERLVANGRAEILHYPASNRTYGEQLGWALDRLAARSDASSYFYVASVDSRLSARARAEIIDLADVGVDCAQQSSLFFGNLGDVSWLAAGEALYQSRWTVEHEVFRYLAGAGRIRWLPQWLRTRWYQHAVGHGLLLSSRYYVSLGGLPRPRYGLEDAALGFAIRSRGGRIHPFSTLECGDAPASLRELQRQRATWVRGPLCALEYRSDRSELLLALQALYGGVKWALGIPVQVGVLARLAPRHRMLAGVALLLGLYGPVLRLMTGLGSLELTTECRPRPRDVARGLTAYPFAAVSCWAGGFRGLCRLLADVVTRTSFVQQPTRQIP